MDPEKKIFCIGLHKTGTSSLDVFAKKSGYSSIHKADWGKIGNINKRLIDSYNFLSDGGGHFNNDGHEFDYDYLYKNYNSKFIFQTRDLKEWVISKCKHAGWTGHTIIQKDDPNKINHESWKYKSLLTVKKFIEYNIDYTNRTLNYFLNNDPHKIIIINICNNSQNTDLLAGFLNIKHPITIPHTNTTKLKAPLSSQVTEYIDAVINNNIDSILNNRTLMEIINSTHIK